MYGIAPSSSKLVALISTDVKSSTEIIYNHEIGENLMKHIRFDWAIKKILRDKANFVILEGFISELLGRSILIDSILERKVS